MNFVVFLLYKNFHGTAVKGGKKMFNKISNM